MIHKPCWAQVDIEEWALGLLLGSAPGCSPDLTSCWLDAEGASLIGTLRKAIGAAAQPRLSGMISSLVERNCVLGTQHATAADSAGLAIAHLLPGVITCAYSPGFAVLAYQRSRT